MLELAAMMAVVVVVVATAAPRFVAERQPYRWSIAGWQSKGQGGMEHSWPK